MGGVGRCRSPRPGEVGSGTCALGSILPPREDAAAAPQAGAQKPPWRLTQARRAKATPPAQSPRLWLCGRRRRRAEHGWGEPQGSPPGGFPRAPVCVSGLPRASWTPRPEPSTCAPACQAVCLPLHGTLKEWRLSPSPRTQGQGRVPESPCLRVQRHGDESDSQLSDSQRPPCWETPSQPSQGGHQSPCRAPRGAEVLVGSPAGIRTDTAGGSLARGPAPPGRAPPGVGPRGGGQQAGAHLTSVLAYH